MACHSPAERAEIADTEVRIVYNLRVFNVPVFFESHQVHQIPQRLTKTERARCVFWSPNGVQIWTTATKVPANLVRGVNPVLDREFSPRPSPPYKNPTNPTNCA
jgi:hypothetical protein